MATGPLTTTVLVDANVLFSRTLRDWLMKCYLQVDGWFEVRWTEDIMAEVFYCLRKKLPAASDRQIGGVRDRLVSIFVNGRIAGYEIDKGIDYPDIFDAHVHAAAVHGDVDFVLTADRGFERLGDLLDELPYELHDPDSFFCLLDDSSPQGIREVTKSQLDYWLGRHGTTNLCTHLKKAGAPLFAERVRRHLQTLNAGSTRACG
ncbi:PIN domain-containing protein [Mycobacteroides abscessus]|uniref:PIN domain-containing protein n=1 Tax=Mycobacteroides abscessus TaxID=36809 RepID=UPI00092AEE38|nr:PIN domain-containing protein [Mycobacteroides abscessus]SHT05767.1 Uncharacterised protein [Mycobacteroides abscessus subsp. abscessus]SHX46461.1 Uncharacterised protein [Mycobacteroides abscessus subsp. abscessus]SKG05724.1 Uncharacterised protein [Mycobacteroides abscessus subsp. abscessus]SKG20344.1 Uncharacterised protein [Mycobacteroides abscessus subsp. abscessus]SKG79300.1 Uncharacterised protein [Mycobacteroides abscessus subsp. abscessus]